MTIEEIFRRIVQAHWAILLACLVLPLAGVVALHVREKPEWIGSVRIQVSDTAPMSSTEADAISSRVLALATTPHLVQEALQQAHAHRDPAQVAAHRVSATRLGTSTVVELAVLDTDPRVAGRVAAALAQQVADFMNRAGEENLHSTLTSTDAKLAAATAHRDHLLRRLAATTGAKERDTVRAALQAAENDLGLLSGQRASMLVADATRNRVAIIDGTAPQVTRTPSTLVARSALALLLGLFCGLTIAILLEAVRPRMASTRSVSRLLGAPLLDRPEPGMPSLAEAVSLAARRQGVETVVLIGIEERDNVVLQRFLRDLAGPAPSEPAAAPAPVTVPADERVRSGFAGHHLGAPEPLVDGRGLEYPSEVRFTDLAGLRPQEEASAGVLVISSSTPHHARFDALNDLVRAMRWPVVAVVPSDVARAYGGRS